MGNPLIKDTQVDKEQIGNGGVNAQWEMRNGNRTDKGKAPVTIFWFDKKVIAKASSKVRDDYTATLKKEPQMLARFKHPNILSLVTPLLDDPKFLGFVTERAVNSLHTLIKENKVGEIFPTELETKFHILDIAETLSFLHTSVRTCHLSISPENIYLMPDGKWKIGGLTFATQIIQDNATDTNLNFNQQGEFMSNPSIKFSAPEVVATPSKGGYASDIFSLGCVIYTLYKMNQDKDTSNPYLVNAETAFEHKNVTSKLDRMDFSCVPAPIRSVVMRMVNFDPTMRVTVSDLLNHNWFKDPFIQTVKILETLYQRDVPQQQVFLKGLAQNILKFEFKFIKSKVVPLIVNLFNNPQLAPAILQIYFKFMEAKNPRFLTNEEFNTLIWPSIKQLTAGKEMSAQALYLLIQNTDLFLEYIDIKELQTVFIPLLIKCFDCGVQKLQVLAIRRVEGLFNKIDYTVLKNQVLPRVLNLCTDPNIEVRKQSLLMLSRTYQIFDKNVINDQILVVLEKLRKLKNNYKINMTMLAIFEGIAKNIGIETISNKILVSLVPMLSDQTISKSEYRAYVSTVHAYLQRIEDEQNKFFENQPDEPPSEQEDELEDQPRREDKQTGGFEFLSAFDEGKSSTQQSSSSGGIGDIDFSSFDNMGSGFSQKPAASPSPGGFNNPQNPTVNRQSANPRPAAAANQGQFGSTNQGGMQQQQKAAPGKSLKDIGNPFGINSQAQAQQKQRPAQSTNTFQMSNSTPSMNQNQGFGQQNNFNMQQSQPAAPQGGWDNLDSDLDNLGLSMNPTFNMNNFGASNTGGNMNMGGNTGFGGNMNNQGNFNMGNNTQFNAGNPSSDGWDDLNIGLGDTNSGLGGFGGNNMGGPNNGSTNNQFGYNQTNQFNMNQGNTFNMGQQNTQFGGMNQGGGFGQNQGNQFNMNPSNNMSNFNQTNQFGMNQNTGFNNVQTTKPAANMAGLNFKKGNQAPATNTQKPQPFGAKQGVGAKKVENADDFFDSFNIPGSDKPKTNTLNFIKKPEFNSNSDDLI